MNGFGHIIWSAVGYLIFMSVLTIILAPLYYWAVLISVGFAVLSLLIQSISAKMEKRKMPRKKFMLLREIALVTLSLSGAILMIFHLYLNYRRYEGVVYLNGVFLFVGLYLSFITSYAPDSDSKMLGIGRHRDPITHSAFGASLIAFLMIFFVPDTYASIVFVFIGITVGYAMHLFCDLIPHGAFGWEKVKAFFNRKKTSGNIIGIDSEREWDYLMLNGMAMMYFSILLAIRSVARSGLISSIITEEGFEPIVLLNPLFLISTLVLLLPFILKRIFRKKKKSKKKKK